MRTPENCLEFTHTNPGISFLLAENKGEADERAVPLWPRIWPPKESVCE